jgi:penicillin-binding protein 1A
VPFLYNAFGIEMAARTYFDTSADDLDVLQSATLVGMLKGNSYYNPVLNPERAVQRRNIVLAQMVKRGQLDAAKFESLKKRPLRVEFERQSEAARAGAALRAAAAQVADRLGRPQRLQHLQRRPRRPHDARLQAAGAGQPGRRAPGLPAAAPRQRRVGRELGVDAGQSAGRGLHARHGGLPAALDGGATPEQALKQLAADTAFMRELRRQKTTIQAGFLALDPQNGQIKAWVGSRDFKEDAFDHVQQARRQPGSTFKPFVYGEAFRQGMSPDDTLVDEAVEIEVGGDEIWRPSDGKPPSGQPMSLADGSPTRRTRSPRS